MSFHPRRPSALTVYLTVVACAGAAVLGGILATAHLPTYDDAMVPAVVLLCAFLALGELFPIKIGHEDAAVSYTFSGTAAVGLIAVGPGWVPVAAQILAACIDEVRYRRPLRKTVFNLAQYTLSVAGGRLAFCLLTGKSFQSVSTAFQPHDLLPSLVSAGVFFLVNALLMSMVLALAQGERLLSLFPAYVRDELGMATTLLAAGPVVLLGLQFSWQVAPICVLPVFAVRNGAKRAAMREFAAMHDPLTGLPNRALLLRRTARTLGEAAGTRTALVLIDLDHFKEINDSLGHAVGDELLRHVAARLQRALREGDTAARLGGDEFAVLCADVTDGAAATAIAERLLDVLGQPYGLNGITLHVEASIGVALAPDHAHDVDTLLQLVDVALYQAKAAGRDTVCLYDPAHDSSSAERLALMAELRADMDEQLVLFYQPKCSAQDGSLVGVEALVRWQHPKLGLLTPDRFLPSAENSGLIVPLTATVLRTALTQLREWDVAGLSTCVAVNISARHLTRPDLPDLVADLLGETGVEADRLTLEITENSIMTDPSRAIMVLQRLHTLGVHISIDDFGTGYSSLAYLRDLSATEVKIDRSFVSGKVSGGRGVAVLRAAAQLGHSFGLTVVAEGVETPDQVRAVADAGVDVLQGYHILPPARAEELLGWVQRPQLWAQALRNIPAARNAADHESMVTT